MKYLELLLLNVCILRKLVQKQALHQFLNWLISQLYLSRMQQLWSLKKVNTTLLKQILLAHFPDMQAHSEGRDIMLVLMKMLVQALSWACEQDSDSGAVHLAQAAQIVRRHLFDHYYNGFFGRNCQEESVPTLLLALVDMILKDQASRTEIVIAHHKHHFQLHNFLILTLQSI